MPHRILPPNETANLARIRKLLHDARHDHPISANDMLLSLEQASDIIDMLLSKVAKLESRTNDAQA